MVHGDSYQSGLANLISTICCWSWKGSGWRMCDWWVVGAVILEKLHGVVFDG
jgi:hypothetical protein